MDRMKRRRWTAAGVFVGILAIAARVAAGASSEAGGDLTQRVEHLEKAVKDLRYSYRVEMRDLMDHIDDLRLRMALNRVVILNTDSPQLHRIETDSGTFFIVVKRKERTATGYLLHLQVGNPYAAAFRGVTLKMQWGKKWAPGSVVTTYEGWRKSLMSADFHYERSLEPGMWTPMVVEISPVMQRRLEYLECEMEVAEAQLKKRLKDAPR